MLRTEKTGCPRAPMPEFAAVEERTCVSSPLAGQVVGIDGEAVHVIDRDRISTWPCVSFTGWFARCICPRPIFFVFRPSARAEHLVAQTNHTENRKRPLSGKPHGSPAPHIQTVSRRIAGAVREKSVPRLAMIFALAVAHDGDPAAGIGQKPQDVAFHAIIDGDDMGFRARCAAIPAPSFTSVSFPFIGAFPWTSARRSWPLMSAALRPAFLPTERRNVKSAGAVNAHHGFCIAISTNQSVKSRYR